MRCEEVKQRYAEYLQRSLEPDTTRALEDHVSSCAACRSEYGGVGELWDALGAVPAAPVPSDRLRERFAAMIAAERASAARRPASRPVRERAWPWVWRGEPLVQMAMAASLLIVGGLVGRFTAPRPMSQEPAIAEMRGELRDMRQMLTLSLLQQQSATERLRGVNWTSQIDRPGNEIVAALLDTLLHDPNVNVRLAAVDALRRFSDRPDVRRGARRAVSDTSSPMLQVAVIDFMVETRDPEAPALFRSLAGNDAIDGAVRDRARWGLQQLAS
jgi:hypothetical protein